MKTEKEKKAVRAELKEQLKTIFKEVQHDMKVRTRNDYFFEIENAEKVMVLKRILKELEAFKEAKQTVKSGELLTKTKTIQIKKENNMVVNETIKKKRNLLPQIKEHKIKKDEFTLEQKVKREQKAVKKYERKVLGGVYKNSYVYGEDLEDLFGFSSKMFNKDSISYIIQKMVVKDFTTMASEKN